VGSPILAAHKTAQRTLIVWDLNKMHKTRELEDTSLSRSIERVSDVSEMQEGEEARDVSFKIEIFVHTLFKTTTDRSASSVSS